MDSARGWLPRNAAKPLIESPIPALIDVRVFEENGTVILSWRPHDSSLSQLPSATASETHDSKDAAIDRAGRLFGIGDAGWVFRGDGAAPTSDDVAQLRDRALVAHHVDLALAIEGLAIVRPRLVNFHVPGSEPSPLWLVLGESDDDYVIFYDAHDGSYGLASFADHQRPVYIGEYGSLWETIEGM